MSALLKLLNRFRRNFFKMIDSKYIEKKLKKRKGKCNKCGKCCLGCVYLSDEECKIYKNRPWWCHKDFPIDEIDKKIFGIRECGFYFR